jgi:hypothetical protein
MKWLCFVAGMAACAGSLACEKQKANDWLVLDDPLAAAVRPADCATVEQTPPDFGWPDIGKDTKYTLNLTYPDGTTKSLPAPQNWANWTEVLPAGTYRWTVTATDARGTRASSPRSFIVGKEAQPFVVPDMDDLLARLKAKPHPRGLPDGKTLDRMARQRPEAVTALRAEVERRLRNTVQPEPSSASVGSNNAAAYDEVKRTLTSLSAYALTRDERYFGDSLRRVKNLASWNPEGSTAYHVRGMDMGARMITWALALGYDWLYERLDASTREALRASLAVRLKQMHQDVIGERSRVARYPRDSHGQLTVVMLGMMATLVAGDVPQAERYVREALPLGLNLTMPWGGEDGGFANGTPYAIWDVGESQGYWYVMRWATGIDFAQKAWVRNFPRFLAYFNPPGTPARLFGDGHADPQINEQQARFGKGLAAFAPTPLARWYASHLAGEDPKRFEYAMAPPAEFGKSGLPPGTPNSLHLPSIGWVAMHSALADPKRVSVYFKSSPPPFGAFNHQHADQNSFVVNAGGERLAIESGYYDRYKSPHWWKWLKTTQAKNAVTYDGGKGQIFFESHGRKMGYGAITRFVSAPDYDIATGDATPAYEGALRQALRSVVYLRPNLIVVHDRLASDVPRQWEWNIHALHEMEILSARKIRIQSGSQTLCVEMLSGPDVRFTQTSDWVAPAKGDTQWHGRFTSAPLPSAEFVFVMNVGCTAVAAQASGGAVRVGSRRLRFEKDQVLVEP